MDVGGVSAIHGYIIPDICFNGIAV